MSHGILKFRILFGHFLFALVVNTHQPMLPVLQRNLDISIGQSSLIPATITMMVLVANLVVGVLIARLGQKTVFIAAVILGIGGALLVSAASGFFLIILAFAMLGLATGSAFTSLTTMYAGLPEEMQNFGLYHAFFGLGGMVAPLLLGTWIRLEWSYEWLFIFYAGLYGLLLILSLASRSMKNTKFSDFKLADVGQVFRTPVVLLGASALGLYAAVEIGSTTWSSNMSIDGYGLDPADASFILSGFWLMFTLIRLFADRAARKFGPIHVVSALTALAGVVVLAWVLGASPYIFILLGALYGPVFPIIQKYVNSHLPARQKGLFNGISYAATSLITTGILPVMGFIGDYRMSLAFVPTLVCIVMLMAVARALRKKAGV